MGLPLALALPRSPSPFTKIKESFKAAKDDSFTLDDEGIKLLETNFKIFGGEIPKGISTKTGEVRVKVKKLLQSIRVIGDVCFALSSHTVSITAFAKIKRGERREFIQRLTNLNKFIEVSEAKQFVREKLSKLSSLDKPSSLSLPTPLKRPLEDIQSHGRGDDGNHSQPTVRLPGELELSGSGRDP